MPKSNEKITKRSKKIYMDYASATPIHPLVSLVMNKFTKENFANSGAIHDFGLKAKKILEANRKMIGELLDAYTNEIIFTSGATESNNLAILGVVGKLAESKLLLVPHIVTTNIEHASVLEVCKYLERNKKAEITYVEVERNGIVDARNIRKALKPNTVLVSVMYANNEIGTMQPIREIAKEIRHYNKKYPHPTSPYCRGRRKEGIIFHTDATQAVNYLPINVKKLGVDLLSFNGAKIYGPKGIGVLYVKRNTPIQNIIFGGGQEFALRPGTENVANVVGLLEALKITEKNKTKETKRLTRLRDYFFKKLMQTFTDNNIIINGDLKNRLPNNINIAIPKVPSDLLVIELDAKGILASAKSACKAGDSKSSHVIRAINKNIKDTDGSLRFSLGRGTVRKDIDQTIKTLSEILNKLKKWYN